MHLGLYLSQEDIADFMEGICFHRKEKISLSPEYNLHCSDWFFPSLLLVLP